MAELSKNQVEAIAKIVASLESQLGQLKSLLQQSGLSVVEEGIVGVYHGDVMITEEGKSYPVPPNYASKTMLVSGDVLRMVEAADGGQAKFKQISKVDRAKAEGVLVKKDGKFEVLTEVGSFRVLTSAVKHYELEAGAAVPIQYAVEHHRGSWAAVVNPARLLKSSPGKDEADTAAPVAKVTKTEPQASQTAGAVGESPVLSGTMEIPSLLSDRAKIEKGPAATDTAAAAVADGAESGQGASHNTSSDTLKDSSEGTPKASPARAETDKKRTAPKKESSARRPRAKSQANESSTKESSPRAAKSESRSAGSKAATGKSSPSTASREPRRAPASAARPAASTPSSAKRTEKAPEVAPVDPASVEYEEDDLF